MMMDFLNILLPLIRNYLGLTQKQDENQLTPFDWSFQIMMGSSLGQRQGLQVLQFKKKLYANCSLNCWEHLSLKVQNVDLDFDVKFSTLMHP